MKYLSFLLLFFIAITGHAQQTYVVSGRVTMAESGTPLQGASVFAQNTTIGTATDADGNFKIYLPGGGYDLVVSFTGRQTESRRVSSEDAKEVLRFSLKEKEKELEEVAVVATNEVKDGWEKYGSFFKDNFIGKTANSSLTTIKNPQVLKFIYSKFRDRLKVKAKEPLLVENRALGYLLTYELDSFVYEYKTNTSVYSGFPRFEAMQPADSAEGARWKEARVEAYEGSMLHFMRSLYDKALAEDGFEVRFLAKNNNGSETEIKLTNPYGALNYQKNDSLHLVEIRPNSLNVAILNALSKPETAYTAAYPAEPKDFQFSFLLFKPGETMFIEQNGYFYEQDDIDINGYWNWKKIADMLPYDYE